VPAMIVAKIPRPDQLVPEHPCFFKPVYYAMFVEPIKDALRAAGCDVRDADRHQRGVVIQFEFPDGASTRAIVDYADQVHIDGLVKFAEGEFDFVFKMKPCDRFGLEYAEYQCQIGWRPEPEPQRHRIYPYGYVIAPTYSGDPDDCNANRKWFFENLWWLRGIRDRSTGGMPMELHDLYGGLIPPPVKLLTRGAFHAMHACPERQRLYDPEYDQGGKDFNYKQHIYEVASAGFVLNACGPDNTIDRKIVEFCAIGSVILSNDGLKDLRLPWGGRFVHGENVWFVNSPADVKTAVATMPEETRQKLIAGSRALWDRCFDPSSIGAWLLRCAFEEGYA
jgi:hypothetical protein